MESVTEVFGNAIGAVDLCDPLRHRPIHAAVIDFLERFALDDVVPHLTYEQNDRRGILMRGMDAERCVGRARTARDETDARTSRELAVRIGHVRRAAFLAADDETDGVACVVQRIEYGEIRFAGNTESHVDAVYFQSIDENLRTGACELRVGGIHCSSGNR